MTTKTEQPTIHKSVETVETVKSMRTGWDISFAGRSNNAYLANSVGDLLDVSYHMDESSRGKFARIVELHSHTPAAGSEKPAAAVSESADESTDESASESAPESAADSVKEFSATVKSLKATAAGLRLDLGYANGAFVSYKTLQDAGVRVEQGDEVSGAFEMDENDEGRFARAAAGRDERTSRPAPLPIGQMKQEE